MAGRKKGGPKYGGRKKGVPNKATADVKAAAQKHGPAAVKILAGLMKTADTDTAKISACKEILDRAYGKPAQAIVGEDGEGPVSIINKILLVAPDASTDR